MVGRGVSPFPPPQSRGEENIQESTAQLVSEANELQAQVVTLIGATDGTEGLLAVLGAKLDSVVSALAAMNTTLDAMNVKLGAGLPPALQNGRLKVTGLL